MEWERAEAELKLGNATQRLQRLEQDVKQLKDKAHNVSQSSQQTGRDAASIRELAEEVEKVSPPPYLRPSAAVRWRVTRDHACVQELDAEIRGRYASVEQLIGSKAVGVAEAKRRARALQQEAKDLLLKASEKLQRLKGDVLQQDEERAGRSAAATCKFHFSVSDLEKSYEDNQRSLEMKAEQLVELEAAVKGLLTEISQKVTVYSTCVF